MKKKTSKLAILKSEPRSGDLSQELIEKISKYPEGDRRLIATIAMRDPRRGASLDDVVVRAAFLANHCRRCHYPTKGAGSLVGGKVFCRECRSTLSDIELLEERAAESERIAARHANSAARIRAEIERLRSRSRRLVIVPEGGNA